MVPIRSEDPLGAIGAYWAERCRPSQWQVDVLQALADVAALAFAHVQPRQAGDRSDTPQTSLASRELSLAAPPLPSREGFQRVIVIGASAGGVPPSWRSSLNPSALRAHPQAVIPFLVTRDHLIARVYHQRTGYWRPDGEGAEVFAPKEWAAALDLLGGQKEQAFVRSAQALLDRHDDALALKVTDLGLLNYPASASLTHLRQQALEQLRERYQQLNPFKFIIYSEWARADLPPIE